MDDRVQAIIELGVDEERAKLAVSRIDSLEKGLKGAEDQAKKATESLRKLAEQGAKLREIGSVMAGTGAAIIGPLVLLATQYTERFRGLEATANKFAAAQQRQTDATSNLGRVTASALLPAMNKVAEIEEKIASFAEKHPELVQAAVGVGGALVVGGGALVMAGTAVSTIAKAAELLQGAGPLAAGFGQLAAVTAVLVGGVVAAVVALKLISAITDDPTMKDHDPLKAFRELVGGAAVILYKAAVEIKKAWDDSQDDFATWVNGIGDKWDKFWSDFNDQFSIFKLQIQGFAEKLYDVIQQSALGKALNMQPRENPNAYGPPKPTTDQQIQVIQDAMAARDKAGPKADPPTLALQKALHAAEYAALMAPSTLQKIGDWIGKFGETGSMGADTDKKVADITTMIKDAVANAMKALGLSSGEGPSTATTNGKAIAPEAVRAYIERQKAIATSDRNYENEKYQAKKDFDQAEQKATADNAAAKAKINEDFMRSELKAAQDFQYEEAKQLKQERRDRARAVEDMVDSLRDAAAKGDVEQFIQAQKAGEKQLKRMDEDFTAADKERVADYQRQREDARQQRDYQLKDQEAQFRKESDERRRTYQQQLTDLKTKHDYEKQEIDRAFAEQIAALQTNLAGLSNIQNQFYSDMTTAAQSFLAKNQGYLQGLLNGGIGAGGSSYTPTSGGGGSNYTPTPGGFHVPISHPGGGGYALGLHYAPRDMFALIHQGEKVIPASMNNSRGGAQITVYNTVGDVVSKRALDGAINEMAGKIADAARSVF